MPPWRNSRARRSLPNASTIDVSGDGTNNAGRDVGQARDEALALGITINGLVILSERRCHWNPEHTNPPGGLAKYYRDNVIGGPGSFVHGGQGFQFLRRGHRQKDDRRNRRRRAAAPARQPAVSLNPCHMALKGSQSPANVGHSGPDAIVRRA